MDEFKNVQKMERKKKGAWEIIGSYFVLSIVSHVFFYHGLLNFDERIRR